MEFCRGMLQEFYRNLKELSERNRKVLGVHEVHWRGWKVLGVHKVHRRIGKCSTSIKFLKAIRKVFGVHQVLQRR